jgi:hypothetical protein
MFHVLIFGVATELFLPELNSGRVDLIECTTGLNLFEPLGQMAPLVPGALLGCSLKPDLLTKAFLGLT